MPQPRFEMASAVVGDTLYVFGGYGKGRKSSNQARAFDLAKNEWRVAPPNCLPQTEIAPQGLARFRGEIGPKSSL